MFIFYNIEVLAFDDNKNKDIQTYREIISDVFAFHNVDLAKFDRVKSVLEFLRNEEEYAVWTVAVSNLNSLLNKYLGSEVYPDIKAYILSVLESPIASLGFEDRSTDSFQTLRCRSEILELACKLDHEGCTDVAVKLFKGLKENGTQISPSLLTMAYQTGLRYGNGEDFDFLWNRLKTTNVDNEGQIIAQALGSTGDVDKLKGYLLSMLEEDTPIRTQDLRVPLSSVLSNYSHVAIVMDELKKNVTMWNDIYTTLDTVLSTIATALHTEQEFTEFEQFLESCTECTDQAKTTAKASLQKARDVTAWAKEHQDDILASLRSNSAIVAPSLFLILTVTALLQARHNFA